MFIGTKNNYKIFYLKSLLDVINNLLIIIIFNLEVTT